MAVAAAERSMSLLISMAQQMVNQLTPAERVGAAQDVAVSMIRDLSPAERADLARTLIRELLRDMTPAERNQTLRSALTNQEAV